jgi:hypothetical protein
LKSGKHHNDRISTLFETYGERSLKVELLKSVIASHEEIHQIEREYVQEFSKSHSILNHVYSKDFNGGRPRIEIDQMFMEIYRKWENNEITAV